MSAERNAMKKWYVMNRNSGDFVIREADDPRIAAESGLSHFAYFNRICDDSQIVVFPVREEIETYFDIKKVYSLSE
jgi:hypothetical protein